MIMNRRDLLKAGGAVIVSFAFESALGRSAAASGRSAKALAERQAAGDKPLDLSETDLGKMRFDALGRHLRLKQRIVFRSQGNDANISSVPFIARSRMRQLS